MNAQEQEIARLQGEYKALKATAKVDSQLVKDLWKCIVRFRAMSAPMSDFDSQAYSIALSHHAKAAKEVELTMQQMRLVRGALHSLGGRV